MKQCGDCNNFFVDLIGICGGVYGTCLYDPVQYEGLGNRDSRTEACRLFEEVTTHDGARSDADSLHAAC